MMKFVPCVATLVPEAFFYFLWQILRREPLLKKDNIKRKPLGPGYCVASYETLWKTPSTLRKSPWRVFGLLIIFSASGFPVIIKFQPATGNLQNIPADSRICKIVHIIEKPISLKITCLPQELLLNHSWPWWILPQVIRDIYISRH